MKLKTWQIIVAGFVVAAALRVMVVIATSMHPPKPTPTEVYLFNRDWQFGIANYRTRTGVSYKEAVELLSAGRFTSNRTGGIMPFQFRQ